MFGDFHPYSFVSSSAYDTAWLAMIPADSYIQPMFKNCLEWLLNNQKQQGFWGQTDAFGKETIDSLPATLASMIALKKWNTGACMIQKGMHAYISSTLVSTVLGITIFNCVNATSYVGCGYVRFYNHNFL